MRPPRLIWDLGTAYDLFISLSVLHEPSTYGLRGAWAKGVRARLPVDEREMLEQAASLVWPISWVHTLPEPKNGATALRALEQIPPAKRLEALAPSLATTPEIAEILKQVIARRAWDEGDRETLEAAIHRTKLAPPQKDTVTNVLEWYSRAQEFGERYLNALRTYFDVFFVEEEARIRPALEAALERAQKLAEHLELSALLEELSYGLRLTELPQVPELVLAPTFWSTPLLVFASVNERRDLILFGARPADASLVPGEVVPDALMRALKALSDPTRLRILRYLTAEPLAPAQLARRLRLRAPTVIHHLDALRMAQLVQLTLEVGDKRRYAARPAAVGDTLAALEAFLKNGAVEGSTSADGGDG
jgi:DNA-binding transcriptional ArsR family regulator